MTEKKVTHEIKLDKHVRILLWGFVLAIALNAMPKPFTIGDAIAELSGGSSITTPFYVEHNLRCTGCD